MPSQATESRRSAIVDLALSAGLASVEELSTRFGVTSSTIRRDLARLTTEGRIARTYGGAIAVIAHAEPTLRQRRGEAHDAKVAIGRWAASQVHPGDTVILDAGSTVGAMAEALRGARDLTVATVSLTVIDELAESEGVVLECLGGRLRTVSGGFVGPLAEAALERMTGDAVFLGTDGVSAEGEICEADLQQTRLKEIMVRRAERVFVLAHGGKIGIAPFHAWLRIPPPWTLVTDATADEECVAALRERGVEVVVVGAD
ncbi:DeoR/GlpR transcriptional regulator [Microbacteriaceae bacterium VKM Ac-2854]|nr:DeoR/GlpR transcriptional regulator [Microbacteriaceae bacterium VKM Ac-2854]